MQRLPTNFTFLSKTFLFLRHSYQNPCSILLFDINAQQQKPKKETNVKQKASKRQKGKKAKRQKGKRHELFKFEQFPLGCEGRRGRWVFDLNRTQSKRSAHRKEGFDTLGGLCIKGAKNIEFLKEVDHIINLGLGPLQAIKGVEGPGAALASPIRLVDMNLVAAGAAKPPSSSQNHLLPIHVLAEGTTAAAAEQGRLNKLGGREAEGRMLLEAVTHCPQEALGIRPGGAVIRVLHNVHAGSRVDSVQDRGKSGGEDQVLLSPDHGNRVGEGKEHTKDGMGVPRLGAPVDGKGGKEAVGTALPGRGVGQLEVIINISRILVDVAEAEEADEDVAKAAREVGKALEGEEAEEEGVEVGLGGHDREQAARADHQHVRDEPWVLGGKEDTEHGAE